MRVNEPDWLFLLRIVLLVPRVEGKMKRRHSRSIAFHRPLFLPLMDPPRGGGSPPPPPRHAGKVGAARGESRTVRRCGGQRGEGRRTPVRLSPSDRLTKTHLLVNSKHKRVCFWVFTQLRSFSFGLASVKSPVAQETVVGRRRPLRGLGRPRGSERRRRRELSGSHCACAHCEP